MILEPEYRLDEALLPDGVTRRFVVVDRQDQLHIEATRWLGFLADVGRSRNTVKGYGIRIAWYLSWTAQMADWRSVSVSHLALWRRVVANTPIVKTNGKQTLRSARTVGLWMTPVRSFYEWADAEGLLSTDVASRMTEVKYFPPGTPAGGENGAHRRVLAPELRPAQTPAEPEPEWIEDPAARAALEALDLNLRDRFLVDLMYYTGIRTGEAMSLFTRDMHFGGGSPELGCRVADPHFHVVLDNPVENDSSAKGCARLLHVSDHLVERYIDYVLERQSILGDDDVSQHVFVNLYSGDEHVGRAMTDRNTRAMVKRCGRDIGYPLSGPHILRHTFATRLVRGIGCEPQPLDVVQVLLGHRSIQSTRIYTHDLEQAKKDAMMAIAPREVDLGEAG